MLLIFEPVVPNGESPPEAGFRFHFANCVSHLEPDKAGDDGLTGDMKQLYPSVQVLSTPCYNVSV